jgi:O-antigen/teichoic acid export membrane protein
MSGAERAAGLGDQGDPRTADASPSTPGKLVSAFGLLVLSSIGGQVLGFIGLALVSRRLGPHNLGAYGFASSLSGYFALPLMAGTAMVGIRDLATPGQARGEIVAEVQTFLSINGIVGYVALIALVPVLTADALSRELLPLAGLPLIINAVGLDWAMQGMQRLRPLAVYRFLGQVLYLAVLVSVLTGGATGAKRYALCNALGFGLTAVLTVVYVYRLVRPRIATLLATPRQFVARLRARSRRSFVPSVSLMMIQIYYSVDVVLLGYLRGDRLVGEYTIAARLPLAVTGLAALWVTTFYPHATTLFYRDRERLRSQIGQFASLSIVAGLPLVVFGFVVGRDMMAGLFGAAYVSSGTTFAILLSSSAAALLNANIGQILLACGDDRGFLASVSLGAILNVALNLALIPPLGTVGSALATLVGESAVIVAAAVRVSRTVGQIDLEWGRVIRGIIAVSGAFALLLLLNGTVGWWSALIVASSAYVVFAIASGAVRLSEVRRVLRRTA